MQLGNSIVQSQPLYDFNKEYLTAADIAEIAGMSKVAVFKKKGLEVFFLGETSDGGRPLKKFHPDVLSLFGFNTDCKMLKLQKVRSHKDKPVKVDVQHEEEFVARTLSIYLTQANRNDVLHSCETAAKELFDSYYAGIFEGWRTMANYFYKQRIKRNDKKNNYIGYAYRNPTWQTQWERRFKKHDIALKRVPTNNYRWLEVMESAGIIGEGFGAGRIWFLDDHIGDSYIRDDEKTSYKGSLPKGLFMVDGVTGMMLDYQPGEVNSAMVALMVIRSVFRYGLPLAIGMENSKVMKNIKVEGALSALYSLDVLDWYANNSGDWFHEIFERAKIPIARNLPNIPRAPFKARLERIFQEVKRHDGWKFPRTFQGGGFDAVQLRTSNTPQQPTQNYSLANYVDSLRDFLSNEYLDKNHPGMFQGFNKKTGLMPNIANVWDYYGGNTNPGTGVPIDSSRFAECLYWLSLMEDGSPVTKRESVALPGRVNCKVDKREYMFLDAEISRYEGRKITIVFIPDSLNNEYSSGDYAALFCVINKVPHFINIAKDNYIYSIHDMKEKKKKTIAVRAEMKRVEEAPFLALPGRQHKYDAINTTTDRITIQQQTGEDKRLFAPVPASEKIEAYFEEIDPELQELLDL